MGAVWMRLRSEARGRWRAWLGLALLAGIPAGIAIAAATGAVRTETVTDRLVAATDPADVYYPPDYQNVKLEFDDIAALPLVKEAVLFKAYGVVAPERFAELEVSAFSIDLPPGTVHLLDGRLPHPDAVDEALVNFEARDRFGLDVGDTVRLRFAPREEGAAGVELAIHIVGISAHPGDFVGVAGPGLTLTSTFAKAYDAELGFDRIFMISLKRGGRDVGAFEDSLSSLAGGGEVLLVDARLGIAQMRRSFHVQAAALWVGAIFIGAAGALVFAQSAARQVLIDSRERGALAALGMTLGEMHRLSLLKASLVAASAATTAAILGTALSPLTPFGLPRLAEPDLGISVPAATFGGGVAIAFLVVLILAFVPALAVRRSIGEAAPRQGRPSAIARALASLTTKPGPSVGARFALETGRGTTAVPVRSSLVASVTGIAALLAALTVGASLSHLVETPRLYGFNWDAVFGGSFEAGSDDLRTLQSDPAVSEITVAGGFEGAILRVGETAFGLIGADPVKGSLGPTLLRGRVPRAADEVALGPKTMQAIGARLGDTIKAAPLVRTDTRSIRVVGEVVLPFDDDVSTVGEGAWMTMAGFAAFYPGADEDITDALIRIAPGVDRAAALERLGKRFEESFGDETPQGVVDYARISNLPTLLSGLLAAMAAGTLAHLLTSSIRRRRRDFAILKTLGFARAQVGSAVGSQAVTFMLVALAIAVPVGTIVGRWTWTLIARSGGFASEPTVRIADLSIVSGASLAAALLIAVLPARSAARSRPAMVLRAE